MTTFILLGMAGLLAVLLLLVAATKAKGDQRNDADGAIYADPDGDGDGGDGGGE